MCSFGARCGRHGIRICTRGKSLRPLQQAWAETVERLEQTGGCLHRGLPLRPAHKNWKPPQTDAVAPPRSLWRLQGLVASSTYRSRRRGRSGGFGEEAIGGFSRATEILQRRYRGWSGDYRTRPQPPPDCRTGGVVAQAAQKLSRNSDTTKAANYCRLRSSALLR